MPPSFGWFSAPRPTPGGSYGNIFFHLLPYIEQDNVFKSGLHTGPNNRGENPGPNQPYYSALNGAGTANAVETRIVKTYLCPSDPSVPPGAIYTSSIFANQFAAGCYACNGWVFATVVEDPNSAFEGYYYTYQGDAQLPRSITDGLSNTILFAEKYARCEGGAIGTPARGTLWDWYTEGWVYMPLFGIQSVWGTGSGLPSKFQVQPKPFLDPGGRCDGARASTSHTAGLQAALADGSVRNISSSISATTWWYAYTPRNGDLLGQDW